MMRVNAAAALAAIALGSPAAAAPSFTPLSPLPVPRIIASSEAYPGGAYRPENLLDGDPRTEYSSASKGVGTHVDLDFGAPVRLAGFRHLDRNDPATVGASRLVLSDDPAFKSPRATIPVEHRKGRGATTLVSFPAVTARYVRFEVTALGPQGHGTVGGAEIAFLASGDPEPLPSRDTLRVSPRQAVLEKDGKKLQPVEIAIDHPYAEEAAARLRVGGGEPIPVTLGLGGRSVETALETIDAPAPLEVSLEVEGRTIVRSEALRRPVRPWVVYILPHSHVDIGYTDLQSNVERQQMENIRRGIRIARETAGNPPGARFRWNTEVLWPVESYLRGASSEEREEFAAAVKSGWLGLDALYSNELTGLCRPEELLRLVRYSTELSRRFGVTIDSMMISDVPGYTWGFTSALAHAGVRYLSLGPNWFDRMGTTIEAWEDRPFWWVSPSGKERLLAWLPYQGYALGHKLNADLKPFLPGHLQRLADSGYPYEVIYFRWSVGGDNGPPDDKLAPMVKEWNEAHVVPRLVIATTAEAFRELERRHGKSLPEARGDFTPYWEDGAASSARETALNRGAAERLVQAETIWALIDPAAFPGEETWRAWRDAILYDEHTWGAHNSITDPDLPFVKDQWKVKQAFALGADASSRKLLEAAISRRGGEREAGAVDVFNTVSWPRTDLVLLSREMSAAGDVVSGPDGQAVPSQRLSTGELAFLAREVPPFAALRYSVRPGRAEARGGAMASGTAIESGEISLRVDEKTGAIVSLKDRRAGGAELVDPRAAVGLGGYLYLPGANPADALPAGPARVSVKESGPLMAALLIESEAPGASRLVREVRVIDGLGRVDISNVIDKKAVRTKEGVHFGFAFDLPAAVMRMDIPWAVMSPEADQIPGTCKNWFTVGRWVDLSSADRGVTWVTLDAPLVEVGELSGNLLGSQPYPKVWRKRVDPAATFYSWVMNNHWHTNYKADQEGPTMFRYSIRPHRGYDPAEAARFGTGLGQPLVAAPAAGRPQARPRLRIEPPTVLATAFKPADDGKALIVRLFGASGKAEKATIEWSDPIPRTVWKSDAGERAIEKVEGPIPVGGFEIVTLRAE